MKGKKKFFEWKWLRISVTALLLATGLRVVTNPAFANPEESILQESAWRPIFPPSVTVVEDFTTTHAYSTFAEAKTSWTVYQQSAKIGSLSITTSTLPSGTFYYFLRYESLAKSEPVVVTLPFSLEAFSYRTIAYPDPQSPNYQTSTWSEPKEAQLYTTLPTEPVFADDSTRSLVLGYVDVYEKHENEVRKERYDLAKGIYLTPTGIDLSLSQVPGTISETWGFVGTKPLIAWSSPEMVDLRMGDFYRVRKWTREGLLLQTPSTYLPSSRESFWLNPFNAVGEKFLRTSGSTFFEDFSLVSLYAPLSWQNSHGYWYTTPKSTWLSKDYGIERYFFDTRFNTDTAMFLLNGYKKYQDPLLLASVERYAQYFSKHAMTKHFVTKNGGYLVEDYAHEAKPKAKTHVSLNHQLSEMNFLYELYITTSNQEYLSLAEKLRQGVVDTALSWENKKTGDLHYAYMVNGSYGLTDYPLLTLKDLRYSQRLLESIYGARDPQFDLLIQVKEAYLRKNSMPLY
ncbi:MAG TPA: hypothetical protein VEZ13_18075 [Brevibacillus sp.]|nr:hypothetical protein [Brevibacillus sp.]